MGGCRCTYKNCSLRSDGVTHMFHYPVFDKVRCHQWLTNAQKLEFLNLKVSQLKNRVVCQHHFKDECFMNFLKDKLTFEAVPTLDGPYCDSSQLVQIKPEQDVSKLYSISLDDIENEYLTLTDKKANFSVKYGDFLTNGDLMDLDSMNVANDDTKMTIRDQNFRSHNLVILNNNNIDRQRAVTANPVLNKIIDTIRTNENDVFTVQVTEVPLEVTEQQMNMIVPNVNEPQIQGQDLNFRIAEKPPNVNKPQIQGHDFNVRLVQEPPNVNEPQIQGQHFNVRLVQEPPNVNEPQIQGQDFNVSQKPIEPPKRHNKSKKITIIDEKKIGKDPIPLPIPFPVKLESISPAAFLTLPSKMRNLNRISQQTDKYEIIKNLAVPDLVESNKVLNEVINTEKIKDVAPTVEVSPKIVNEVISPEKNMNIVPTFEVSKQLDNSIDEGHTHCNSKIENPASNKTNDINTFKLSLKNSQSYANNRVKVKTLNCSLLKSRMPPERMAAIEKKRKFNMKLRDIIASCLDKLEDEEMNDSDNSKVKAKLKNDITENVNTYLSKEPELPGLQDYAVAYLEARMKKMEDVLLNKIDQNTLRITELKTLLKPSVSKKVAHTQTSLSEESQKKQLYHEISKYLSPKANSLLYEELFINKYSQKVQAGSPAKKRRYRR